MRSRDVVILSHGNTVFTSDTRVEVGTFNISPENFGFGWKVEGGNHKLTEPSPYYPDIGIKCTTYRREL